MAIKWENPQNSIPSPYELEMIFAYFGLVYVYNVQTTTREIFSQSELNVMSTLDKQN